MSVWPAICGNSSTLDRRRRWWETLRGLWNVPVSGNVTDAWLCSVKGKETTVPIIDIVICRR